jgi:hypothetical protein
MCYLLKPLTSEFSGSYQKNVDQSLSKNFKKINISCLKQCFIIGYNSFEINSKLGTAKLPD